MEDGNRGFIFTAPEFLPIGYINRLFGLPVSVLAEMVVMVVPIESLASQISRGRVKCNFCKRDP